MKKLTFITALFITALTLLLFSCKKEMQPTLEDESISQNASGANVTGIHHESSEKNYITNNIAQTNICKSTK